MPDTKDKDGSFVVTKPRSAPSKPTEIRIPFQVGSLILKRHSTRWFSKTSDHMKWKNKSNSAAMAKFNLVHSGRNP